MKCLYLDNLSVTSKIVSYTFDFGNPSIKSIVISSQTCSSIGSGCRNGAIVSYLWC